MKNKIEVFNHDVDKNEKAILKLVNYYVNKGISKEDALKDIEKQLDKYRIEFKGLPKFMNVAWDKFGKVK